MSADTPNSLDRVYNLAENAEWQRLLDYLAFLEGFGLILLLAPEQAGVDVCRRALRQHYGNENRTLHSLRLRLGERPGALGDHLLNDPLPEDAGAVWVDAPETASALDEAPIHELWCRSLAALNPRRNPLSRRLRIPLICAGPMWLQEDFQRAAADLWSIRDTIVRVEPPERHFSAGTFSEMKLESGGGEPEGEPGDPDETRRALDRLRKKVAPRAHRAEQCALEGRLLQRLGNQLRRQYQWEEAEDALLEAEDLMEKNPRALDDQVRLLFDLYMLYSSWGSPDRAEHYARRANEFTKVHYGPEDRSTLGAQNNLGIQLRAQGRHAEAEREHREVLAIRERVLGVEHPDTLTSWSNLAIAMDNQGKHAEAERELRAVLAVCERVLGNDHPDVFHTCCNLAYMLEGQGKNKEALPFAQRAERGWHKVLGAEHPDTKDAKKLREGIELELQSKQASD